MLIKTTHLLKCTHAVGRARKEYLMRCNVLKVMPDGRLKLRVFGDRYWKHGNRDINGTVRYVDSGRVQASVMIVDTMDI